MAKAKTAEVVVSRIDSESSRHNIYYGIVDGVEVLLHTPMQAAGKLSLAVGDTVKVYVSQAMRTVRATGARCSVQFFDSLPDGAKKNYTIAI